MSTDIETSQPFSSATTTEYVPADKPSTIELSASTPVQVYVYTPVPPVTVTSIEPSLAPLHDTPYPL